jgi:tRNA nucleotidyltransferase (CCA-adding enzyme)
MSTGINKKDIPQEVLDIVQKLEEKNFEAFLVGGCVRDLLMKRTPKDWDITTNAKPEEILDIFGDKAFYENDFGTVGIKNKEAVDKSVSVVEVTPYRLESKYSDKRHPDEVKFSEKLEDDLKRRDFTINALAYNVSQETLEDHYNGLKDIKDKIIRTVGKPEDRFEEDSLRMLRAIRFVSELNFTLESNTLNAIYVSRDTINAVSRERIREEFEKIILSDSPMIGLALCEKVGLLPHIAKPLQDTVDVSQNKEAHKYDVWEHSLRSLQHAADKGYSLEIRLAALFHDISKPKTKREEGSKTTFYGHEVVGERVTRETLEDLKFSRETIDKVSLLVRWHMFFADPDEITLTAVRRLVARVGEENIWDLMNLRVCDRIGTGRPKEEPYRLRKYKSMVEEALRDPISLKKLKIDGDILIKELHMKPGRQMGDILYALFDEVLEDPKKNDQKYLKDRAIELSKLSEKELGKLGKKGREALESEEGKELEEIRSKHHVK